MDEQAYNKVELDVLRKITGYTAATGTKPLLIVVSRDIYNELKKSKRMSEYLYDDRLHGLLISVLQSDTTNQILLFR